MTMWSKDKNITRMRRLIHLGSLLIVGIYFHKNDESQRHTDAELDQIYRRVKKYLQKHCGKKPTISGGGDSYRHA